MKVSIFGATGMVGKVLTGAALEAGHDVTALVRSPQKLGDLSGKISVIEGEYFDKAAQQKTVDGADAVLTTIGPPMKRTPNGGEYSAAMASLIGAMEAASVKRIVSIAGAGVRLGDEKMTFGRAFMRRVLILLAGGNYLDKENEHNALFHSSLDWTIVRPPQITNAKGARTLSTDKVAGMKVDTQQLAKYMVESLSDPDTIKTAPFIATV